jgi:lipopolysaccharide export system protein LptA
LMGGWRYGRHLLAVLAAASVLATLFQVDAAEKPTPVWKTGSAPLQVDSKTLEALGNQGMIIFQGDVVARQGDVTLQADRVEVRVDRATREIRTVEARGNVRIRKGEIVATGEEATYEAGTGVAVLTGKPKVWRGQDVVAGDRITLYLAEDRSLVEGARAVIYQGPPAGGESK